MKEENESNEKSKLTEQTRLSLEPRTSWATDILGFVNDKFFSISFLNGTRSSNKVPVRSSNLNTSNGVTVSGNEITTSGRFAEVDVIFTLTGIFWIFASQ